MKYGDGDPLRGEAVLAEDEQKDAKKEKKKKDKKEKKGALAQWSSRMTGMMLGGDEAEKLLEEQDDKYEE
jgi:hypothetical protein